MYVHFRGAEGSANSDVGFQGVGFQGIMWFELEDVFLNDNLWE